MSRLKKFTRSLLSGYVLLGVNIFYTLASVPLALHYLSNEEFGLWAAVTQIASLQLLVVDFGISGSIYRILIDHKDDKASRHYGSVVRTGFWVLFVQGIIIAAVGSLLSFWLPQWMAVPQNFWFIFRLLLIGQFVFFGILFCGRMYDSILQAHQRYDLCNYSITGSFVVNFTALWLGFKMAMGLYSLLFAFATGLLFGILANGLQVWRLGLLPKRENPGHPNLATFREMFGYGANIFLLSLGNQLIFASQVPVITRALGLEAAATWSIASKLFLLAQQVVFKMSDYASGAFAEMMVRKEQDQLKARFHDLVLLTGSGGAVMFLAVALCNESFLKIWTHNRIFWGFGNDCMFALMMIVYSNTRCHIGLAGLTKQIRAMKYVYFIEGLLFVVSGFLLAQRFGMMGIMASAILSDLLCGGLYGLRRSAQYFGISMWKMLFNWYQKTFQLLVVMPLAVWLLWRLTQPLGTMARLFVETAGVSIVGLWLFWRLGLSEPLRLEARRMMARMGERFPFAKKFVPS